MEPTLPCIHDDLCRAIYSHTHFIWDSKCPVCQFYIPTPPKKPGCKRVYHACDIPETYEAWKNAEEEIQEEARTREEYHRPILTIEDLPKHTFGSEKR